MKMALESMHNFNVDLPPNIEQSELKYNYCSLT